MDLVALVADALGLHRRAERVQEIVARLRKETSDSKWQAELAQQEAQERFKDLIRRAASDVGKGVHEHLDQIVEQIRLLNSGKDVPAAPIPDVRVNVLAMQALTQLGRVMLVIKAENHSAVEVYIQSFALETGSQSGLWIPFDHLHGTANAEFVLPPGDSRSFHMRAQSLLDDPSVSLNSIVRAIVTDKIGRVFRSSEKDMQDALHNLSVLLGR